MGKPKAYRDNVYSIYVSTHTSHLYGETTINGIERQFPAWKWYYGKFLTKDKSAKILDAGCGNGGFLYFLRSLGYENAAGIDISQEQVEVSKRLGIDGVDCTDIMSFLRDEKDSYDLIFARDVIEHLTKNEVFDTLQIIFKALKANGVFIIQTPNGESPFGRGLGYGDFTHEVIFTRSSLNQVLQATGFKDINFYPTGPVPKGFKSRLRYIIWKGVVAILRFYVLIETGAKDGIFTQTLIARASK